MIFVFKFGIDIPRLCSLAGIFDGKFIQLKCICMPESCLTKV